MKKNINEAEKAIALNCLSKSDRSILANYGIRFKYDKEYDEVEVQSDDFDKLIIFFEEEKKMTARQIFAKYPESK